MNKNANIMEVEYKINSNNILNTYDIPHSTYDLSHKGG